MTYILLFTFSTILFFLAQKVISRSALFFYILSFIAIFTLSFVAGVRDNCIGTDVAVYGIRVYHAASSGHNFWRAYDSVSSVSELFYFVINYVSVLIYDKLGVSLFMQMLIQTTFVFFGMKRYMSKAPLWLTMLIYQLLFYNLTLNLMRQGIAIAFLLWAFKYVEQKQLKYFLICTVLVFFFHKTGLIAAVIMLLICWATKFDEHKQKKLLFIAAIASALGVIFFALVINMLSNINSEFSHFLAYAEGTTFKAGVSTMDILMRSAFLVITLFFYNKNCLEKTQMHVLLLLLIADFGALLLGNYTYFATRFSYYFIIIEIPYIVMILNSNNLEIRTRYLANTAFILFFVYYCIRFNFVDGLNETFPYKSEFLFIN